MAEHHDQDTAVGATELLDLVRQGVAPKAAGL